MVTSVNAPNAGPNASSLKATPSKKKKRALAEVIAEIPSLDSIQFNLINQETSRRPQLRLPDDLNIYNPYALFTLFFPEDLFETLVTNTNIYTI
jgi:hypothetical protein